MIHKPYIKLQDMYIIANELIIKIRHEIYWFCDFLTNNIYHQNWLILTC
jgi:hypothetical protein